MGNRPINRRPWRRAPWRKSRRKAQWVDGLSAGSFDRENPPAEGVPFETPCIIPILDIGCDSFGQEDRSTVRTVWAGPTDADHLDENEALIERVVGDISVRVGGTEVQANGFTMPLVRFGMLAVEEVTPGDATQYESISLWQNDHLQDYEWMFLRQVDPVLMPQAIDVNTLFSGQYTFHVDVRTRRKLGRQDAVLLLASFVRPTLDDAEPGGSVSVHAYPLLRVVHTTR